MKKINIFLFLIVCPFLSINTRTIIIKNKTTRTVTAGTFGDIQKNSERSFKNASNEKLSVPFMINKQKVFFTTAAGTTDICLEVDNAGVRRCQLSPPVSPSNKKQGTVLQSYDQDPHGYYK